MPSAPAGSARATAQTGNRARSCDGPVGIDGDVVDIDAQSVRSALLATSKLLRDSTPDLPAEVPAPRHAGEAARITLLDRPSQFGTSQRRIACMGLPRNAWPHKAMGHGAPPATLTLGFSKKLENLVAATALHFAVDNFCRIHGSLKCTRRWLQASSTSTLEHGRSVQCGDRARGEGTPKAKRDRWIQRLIDRLQRGG